jgi:hypothetical protein
MRLEKPFAVLRQRRIRRLLNACLQSLMQMHQLARHRWLLRTRRNRTHSGQALPGLDHVRNADRKPLGRLPRAQIRRRQNTLPQIL